MSSSLNPFQRFAVESEGHVLVTACPGSGKTKVIEHRAAKFLKERKGRLIAVSFTKDSADELKHRILSLVGNEHKNRIMAVTFHRLCINQTKTNNPDQKVKLITERERTLLIKKIACRYKDVSFDDAIEAIDFYKSKMNPTPSSDERYLIYKAYEDSLQKLGIKDFSDLLIDGVKEIQNGNEKPIAAELMLIDEMQDIDDIQYELISCYIKAGTTIMGVGDDDQSLYSFRNALGFEGMMRFLQENSAKLVTLPINYRCSPDILMPAVKLIEFNKSRVPKDIQAGKTNQGEVNVLFFENDNCEADEVTKSIIIGDVNFSEWAVLARNNRLLDKVEASLKSMQIPYSRAGDKFMDGNEAQALVSALTSLVDTEIKIGIHHTLAWMGVSDAVITSFVDDYHGDINGMYQSLPKEHPNKKILKEFLDLFSQWLTLIDEGGKEGLVIKAVATYLKRFLDEKKHHLIDLAVTIISRYKGTIKQRLAQLNQESSKESEGVRLLTMHSSKGLEFDNVWIVGSNEDVIPGDKTNNLEEERRIFYVAMTRARSQLIISYTGTPTRFITESGLA